jgi:hypothetical protein
MQGGGGAEQCFAQSQAKAWRTVRFDLRYSALLTL